MTQKTGIMKRISQVGGMTMISRVFGFLRDILMARGLGAGAVSDAFFIAFKLPNFFRRLFAEGAFSAGFVPLISAAVGKDITPESRKKAETLAADVLSWFFPILLITLLVMEAMMVPIMTGLTGGFDGQTMNGALPADSNSLSIQEKFDLTVLLGRLTFPYLLFISLVAFLAAILNAFNRFSAAAFAPVILNICMISALFIADGQNQVISAQYLAIAVSISGFGQMAWLYYHARKIGFRFHIHRPRMNDSIKKLLTLIAPAAFGAGIMQVNLLVDIILAARYLDNGAVSWLFYADRLNQLPIGVIGVAASTVILPQMSRLLSSGDTSGAIKAQNKALEFSLLLTLPAAAALFAFAPILIGALFERASFTSADTAFSAAALSAYAIGLPAVILSKIFTPSYHARQNTKTPVKIALVALVVNITANLMLIDPYGHVGLALGTTISSWVVVVLYYAGLRRGGLFYFTAGTLKRLFLMIISAGVMVAGLYGLFYLAADHMPALLHAPLIILLWLVPCGALLYGFSILVTGAFTLSGIKASFRK